MLNQIKRCATCAKHTPHTPTGDCTWCVIAYARQVEAAIEAVDLANSAAIAEAARDLPGDRYALRVLVNQARSAYIDLCVKDVIADFGEEGATSWAGEVECGQHDWNLPLLAQAAARALGCFGHAVPLSLSLWD
jgi:hypothetical protein